MPVSSTDRIRVYEVIGLPPEGSDQTIVTTIAHMPITQLGTWEPTFTHTQISNIRASIDANLASTSAGNDARIIMWLNEWDKIVISPLMVSKADNGVEGVLVDDEKTRDIIRLRIGNAIGIWVPKGGWMGEVGNVFTPTGYPHTGNGGGRY